MAQHAVADGSIEDAIENFMKNVASQYGRIDVLFNNAGINRRDTSFDLLIADWNAVVAVNMTGMFLCARAATRHMRDGGGIVNTASILGIPGGWHLNIAYQAT